MRKPSRSSSARASAASVNLLALMAEVYRVTNSPQRVASNRSVRARTLRDTA